MTALTRGLVVAIAQMALVAGVGAKFQMDRTRYPRTWVRTAPVDPMLPIRGRYVSLRLEVGAASDLYFNQPMAAQRPGSTGGVPPPHVEYRRVTLAFENGRLVAHAGAESDPHAVSATLQIRDAAMLVTVSNPIAYFIPATVPDPSRREAGEQLWVEVTVPPAGAPRPIRLGVMRGQTLTPLDLR
jgi:hypothetical protein